MVKKKSKAEKSPKSKAETVTGEKEAKQIVDDKKKTSKLTILLLTLIPLVAAVAGVAYYIYIFLPSTPENVLRTAVNDLLQNPSSYTINGEFETESKKELNYRFSVSSDVNGSQELTVTTDAPLTDGVINLRRVNEKYYANFADFINQDELDEAAKDFEGSLDLDNKLLDFAKRTKIEENQESWMEVPQFVFYQPVTANSKIASELDSFENDSYILNNYSDESNDQREYSLNVESNNIYRLAKQMDHGRRGFVTDSLLLYEQNNRDFPDAITLNIAINTKTKKINQISFASSAFDAASLSLTVTPDESNNEIIMPNVSTVESILGYEFVDSALFAETFQVGANLADRQKVADIKAIAMALQVHKTHTGFYPDRSEVADGLDFFEIAMPSVERSFFLDSNGKSIGLNGSLYAYVSERNDDELNCPDEVECVSDKTTCGEFVNIRCHKFWVATTLSDGSEFKIVAN